MSGQDIHMYSTYTYICRNIFLPRWNLLGLGVRLCHRENKYEYMHMDHVTLHVVSWTLVSIKVSHLLVIIWMSELKVFVKEFSRERALTINDQEDYYIWRTPQQSIKTRPRRKCTIRRSEHDYKTYLLGRSLKLMFIVCCPVWRSCDKHVINCEMYTVS